MTRRLRASRTAVCCLLVGLAVALLPAAGQAQSDASKAISAQLTAPAKGYVQPRTEWGDPDISGVWTSDAALGIPRERPEKFGDRAFLNDQEFADAQKADAEERAAPRPGPVLLDHRIAARQAPRSGHEREVGDADRGGGGRRGRCRRSRRRGLRPGRQRPDGLAEQPHSHEERGRSHPPIVQTRGAVTSRKALQCPQRRPLLHRETLR